MQWSSVSDNAKHPAIQWGSGNNRSGKPYDIQPGEELIGEIVSIKHVTTQYQNDKHRNLIISLIVKDIKGNKSLMDGQPRTLFFKDSKRKNLLMQGVAIGDMLGLLYEGKDANNYHQLNIRLAEKPGPRTISEDPMGIEVDLKQQAPQQNFQQTGFAASPQVQGGWNA